MTKQRFNTEFVINYKLDSNKLLKYITKLERLKMVINEKTTLQAAIDFIQIGSTVWGGATKESDIDFLVLLSGDDAVEVHFAASLAGIEVFTAYDGATDELYCDYSYKVEVDGKLHNYMVYTNSSHYKRMVIASEKTAAYFKGTSTNKAERVAVYDREISKVFPDEDVL